MKGNSLSLKACLLLITPALFAGASEVTKTAGDSYFSMELGEQLESKPPAASEEQEAPQAEPEVNRDAQEEAPVEKEEGWYSYSAEPAEKEYEGGATTSESNRSGKMFSFPVCVGGEIRGLAVTASWHPKSTATAKHLDKLTSGITNNAAFVYQDGHDNIINKTLAARLTAKTEIFTDYTLMIGLGYEMELPDAQGYRPVDVGAVTASDVTTATWNAQDSTSTKITTDKTLAPCAFIGYGALALGVEYDMRQYTVTGHISTLGAYLNKTDLEDHQLLYGFRGEQAVELGDLGFTVSYEYMTNWGQDTGSEMKNYFVDLAKYGADVELSEGSSVVVSAGLLKGTGVVSATSARSVVSAVNTNFTKASVGLGMKFLDL